MADFSHSFRRKDPDRPVIVVRDDYQSYFSVYIKNTLVLDLRRVALPHYSPDLNPIGQIWKSVEYALLPRDTSDLATYRSHICTVFQNYADRPSFAEPWIERFC